MGEHGSGGPFRRDALDEFVTFPRVHPDGEGPSTFVPSRRPASYEVWRAAVEVVLYFGDCWYVKPESRRLSGRHWWQADEAAIIRLGRGCRPPCSMRKAVTVCKLGLGGRALTRDGEKDWKAIASKEEHG